MKFNKKLKVSITEEMFVDLKERAEKVDKKVSEYMRDLLIKDKKNA
jgi:hypothetical protein